MSANLNTKRDLDGSAIYHLRIKGHLSAQWADWFGGATISLQENGDTVLTSPPVDQAALYRLLRRVRDLGMPLISLNRATPDGADTSDIAP
jgi:hypothetical protein